MVTHARFLLILLLFCASPALLSAEKDRLPKIFILHSYGQHDIFGIPQEKGILRALADAWYLPERDFKLTVFYMDTRKANTSQEAMQSIARTARRQIDREKPDILITCDDNAFSLVALDLVDQPGLSIVYTGLNGLPQDYNRQKKFYDTPEHPGHNVTGVFEKLHVADAFRIHREIFPETKEILVITDRSRTSQALAKQVDQELKGKAGWRKAEAASWEEYQRIIHEAAKDPDISAIYPLTTLLNSREDETKTYSVLDIVSWTSQNFPKPEIALNFAFCQHGLFGGAVIDYTDMGRQAGTLALKILKGARAGDLPLESAHRFTLVFNIAKAERIRITIPEDILLAAEEIYK